MAIVQPAPWAEAVGRLVQTNLVSLLSQVGEGGRAVAIQGTPLGQLSRMERILAGIPKTAALPYDHLRAQLASCGGLFGTSPDQGLGSALEIVLREIQYLEMSLGTSPSPQSIPADAVWQVFLDNGALFHQLRALRHLFETGLRPALDNFALTDALTTGAMEVHGTPCTDIGTILQLEGEIGQKLDCIQDILAGRNRALQARRHRIERDKITVDGCNGALQPLQGLMEEARGKILGLRREMAAAYTAVDPLKGRSEISYDEFASLSRTTIAECRKGVATLQQRLTGEVARLGEDTKIGPLLAAGADRPEPIAKIVERLNRLQRIMERLVGEADRLLETIDLLETRRPWSPARPYPQPTLEPASLGRRFQFGSEEAAPAQGFLEAIPPYFHTKINRILIMAILAPDDQVYQWLLGFLGHNRTLVAIRNGGETLVGLSDSVPPFPEAGSINIRASCRTRTVSTGDILWSYSLLDPHLFPLLKLFYLIQRLPVNEQKMITLLTAGVRIFTNSTDLTEITNHCINNPGLRQELIARLLTKIEPIRDRLARARAKTTSIARLNRLFPGFLRGRGLTSLNQEEQDALFYCCIWGDLLEALPEEEEEMRNEFAGAPWSSLFPEAPPPQWERSMFQHWLESAATVSLGPMQQALGGSTVISTSQECYLSFDPRFQGRRPTDPNPVRIRDEITGEEVTLNPAPQATRWGRYNDLPVGHPYRLQVERLLGILSIPSRLTDVIATLFERRFQKDTRPYWQDFIHHFTERPEEDIQTLRRKMAQWVVDRQWKLGQLPRVGKLILDVEQLTPQDLYQNILAVNDHFPLAFWMTLWAFYPHGGLPQDVLNTARNAPLSGREGRLADLFRTVGQGRA